MPHLVERVQTKKIAPTTADIRAQHIRTLLPQNITDYFGKETLDVKLTLHNQIMHYEAIIGKLFTLNIRPLFRH